MRGNTSKNGTTNICKIFYICKKKSKFILIVRHNELKTRGKVGTEHFV